jgi:nucleotide-binding universal stress UspA family protein
VIPPRTILAAVRFSSASRATLALAGGVAHRHGASLHVVAVDDPLLAAGADRRGIDLAASSRTELRRLIRESWPASDCGPTIHAIAGSEVDGVLHLAHTHGVDLIVVGGGRRSLLDRLIFGSATERLLRRSDVSVLVAPPDWPADDVDASVLSSCLRVVRGGTRSNASRIPYRALSQAAMPILLQVVESVLV